MVICQLSAMYYISRVVKYLEIFNQLLARDLRTINFLHNKVAGGKKG